MSPDRDQVLEQVRDDLKATLARVEAALAANPPPPAGEAVVGAPPEPRRALANPAAFFDVVRTRPPLGPSLTQAEVDGCTRILTACAGQPLSFAAYILATDFHETAGQMVPLREYGRGAGRPYGKPGKHGGQVAYGRGDVQLTWDANYELADQKLGLQGRLLANFDLALDPQISAQILVRGMTEGWFTGKRLADYLPAGGPAAKDPLMDARRVVNGTDRAELIAEYALNFQPALQAGGWADPVQHHPV